PAHTVRTYKQAWTDPAHIVTGGAFLLAEHATNHRTVLVPNRRYYEADLVKLKRLTFIPVAVGSTAVNLYKSGAVDAMPGDRLPQEIYPLLGKKKDFHFTAAFMTVYPLMNTNRSPFHNPRVRYAFNMATNKKEVSDFFGAGRKPAGQFVPPLPSYQGPENIRVQLENRSVNVLEYNPQAARELMSAAGFSQRNKLAVEYLFPTLPHSRPIAEILQQQWQRELHVEVKLVLQEF